MCPPGQPGHSESRHQPCGLRPLGHLGAGGPHCVTPTRVCVTSCWAIVFSLVPVELAGGSRTRWGLGGDVWSPALHWFGSVFKTPRCPEFRCREGWPQPVAPTKGDDNENGDPEPRLGNCRHWRCDPGLPFARQLPDPRGEVVGDGGSVGGWACMWALVCVDLCGCHRPSDGGDSLVVPVVAPATLPPPPLPGLQQMLGCSPSL